MTDSSCVNTYIFHLLPLAGLQPHCSKNVNRFAYLILVLMPEIDCVSIFLLRRESLSPLCIVACYSVTLSSLSHLSVQQFLSASISDLPWETCKRLLPGKFLSHSPLVLDPYLTTFIVVLEALLNWCNVSSGLIIKDPILALFCMYISNYCLQAIGLSKYFFVSLMIYVYSLCWYSLSGGFSSVFTFHLDFYFEVYSLLPQKYLVFVSTLFFIYSANVSLRLLVSCSLRHCCMHSRESCWASGSGFRVIPPQRDQ